MSRSVNTTPMLDRVVRAIRLDSTLFDEVAGDPSLSREALLVVVIVAIVGSVGALLGALFAFDLGRALLVGIMTIVASLVGYFIWSFVIHFVGTRLLGGAGDTGRVRRAIGYSYSPNLFGFFAFIPCVGGLIALAAAIWTLVAGIIAVRQSLGLTTGRAIVTAVIGWIIVMLFTVALALIFGVNASWMVSGPN